MANGTLRIVFWNETYLPQIGGVEVFTERLGTGLMRRGHEIFVIADQIPQGSPKSETLNGIAVHRFPFRAAFRSVNNPGDVPRAPRQLVRIRQDVMELKARIGADIVHVNFHGPSSYFHLGGIRSATHRTVVAFQTALTTKAGEDGLIRSLLKEAVAVVTPSRAAARNIEVCTAYPSERISVIAPGIPADDVTGKADRGSGLPSVIFVGRLVEEKGADVAVRAMHQLNGTAKLDIIGDGPQRATLEELTRELSLEGVVRFYGQVGDDQKRRMLAEASVMIVPSRHEELFGMVAAEAALASLPVVASDRGGLPEVVTDQETGILIPPDDASALAAALRRLLDDPALAAKMGRAGRSRTLREYSLEKMVDRYETLYFAACATEPTSRA